MATGEDKWGRKLGTSDLVLMGVGAILPFVGIPVLCGGKAIVKRFDHKAKIAEELVAQFEKVGVTADNKKIIDEMIQLVKKGKNPFLRPDLQEAFHEVLKRNRGKPPFVKSSRENELLIRLLGKNYDKGLGNVCL